MFGYGLEFAEVAKKGYSLELGLIKRGNACERIVGLIVVKHSYLL